MKELIEYLSENFTMIFELIGLLIILRISAFIPKKARINTRIVVLLLLIESIAFKVEQWLGGLDTFYIARAMLTATVYSIYPIILFFVMKIMVDANTSIKKQLLILIPIFICIPIYFSSYWTHIVFTFSEENHYIGGLISWLPYIVFFGYAVLFLVINFFYFKQYTKSSRAILYYIIVFPLIGVLLAVFFGSTKDFTLMFTTSIVLYYLFIYIHLSKIDPLTSLFNRQSYYQDMDAYKDSITGVVSVDMNYLKTINDQYGHNAGDEALVTISKIMIEYKGNKAFVYRIGGDEFVIFYFNETKENIEKAIEVMREKIKEANYSCAFGYYMKSYFESVEGAVRLSERIMYVEKEKIKREDNYNKQ